MSRLLFSLKVGGGVHLGCVCVCVCVCPLGLRAPLNSRGGHIRSSALASTVKSGSRSGIPTLMLTVTLCCLTISLAACKSVVLGDQVNPARSTDPAFHPPWHPLQRKEGEMYRWRRPPSLFQFRRGILTLDHHPLKLHRRHTCIYLYAYMCV